MAWDTVLLAWVAGFFDGEGSIELTNGQHKNRTSVNGRYGLTIEICNTSLKALEQLQKYFGGNIRERHSILYRKHTYRWSLSGNNANCFLRTIKPFLCVKNNEADLAIDFYKTVGRRGVKVDNAILAYRDTLKCQIQQLRHSEVL
jgi:hypothetical protein